MAKKKEWDKIKVLKKISREEQRLYGKSGPHRDKRERRQQRKNTQDYLAELDESEEVEVEPETTEEGEHDE